MKYSEIREMCRPRGGVPGCPHDGLGCPYGEDCSINSQDPEIRGKAWNATVFGPDFICQKRLHAEKPKGA